MLFQDVVAEGLVGLGVDTVFGLIGDGNLFVMDSFRRLPGTRYVAVVNEASAVEAASGFAQVSGRLGVATVTHGPALTNTVTALVEAVKARVPVLLLAGDVDPGNRVHQQKIAQREVVVAAGAGFELLRGPGTVAEDLAVAVWRAQVERRPVVLNMSAAFQWQEAESVPVVPRPVVGVPAPSEGALDAALGVIASANRPVVVAGRGAVGAGGREAVLRFAHRMGAPVATSLKARELFRGDPHDLGISGTLSHEVAVSTFAAADCVVVFGAGLNRYTTAEGSLVQGRAVVQVDDDREALGRFVVPDVGVLGDVVVTADAFVALLDEGGVEPTGFASAQLAAQLAGRVDGHRDRSTDTHVDIHTAVRRVHAAVPTHRTVVTDSGRFHVATWPVVGVEDPRHFVHTANYGSIGLGMGTAIGAGTARADHPTLLVTGDGGFMLGGLNEFNTAVRHGLDLIVLLLNDGAYGAEHIQFVRRDLDPVMSTLDWPDFGPVADALGGRGFTVRTLAELDEALAYLPHRDRPVLIDVHTDPDLAPSADAH